MHVQSRAVIHTAGFESAMKSEIQTMKSSEQYW